MYQSVTATERLSSFVDKLLQPVAQQQKSFLKDTTHFINFLEQTKVPENTCYNGRYELIYKYTTRGGNKLSMQRIGSIPQKRTSYPYTTTAKRAQTYLSGELLPI